jgi:hypothetical protein
MALPALAVAWGISKLLKRKKKKGVEEPVYQLTPEEQQRMYETEREDVLREMKGLTEERAERLARAGMGRSRIGAYQLGALKERILPSLLAGRRAISLRASELAMRERERKAEERARRKEGKRRLIGGILGTIGEAYAGKLFGLK